jgi:uncharacterized protein (DUF2062 family)
MMVWVKNFFKKLIYQERSAEKLALSFCIGNYIAFSPFPGFHTLMVFLFSWMFSLNLGVTFASSCFINNPWTMIPVYGSDYIFGYWLLHKVFNLNFEVFEPWWMYYINMFCEKTLGIAKPCIISFIVGGNILGIGLSILLYPLMKRVFAYYLTLEFGTAYESNYTK